MNIKTLTRMNNIICINFVLILFFLRPSESKYADFDPVKCTHRFLGRAYVCGTDGKTYTNIFRLRCAQHTEYGKRVNLEVGHKHVCYPWEEYIENTTILFILLGLVMLGVGICLKKRTIKKKEEPFNYVDLEQIDTQQK